uniref:Uncharacterized protein n=1 Tax=Anguilla anguilla TaxID=7936 RepID=A0A0E9PZD7_ANGAN
MIFVTDNVIGHTIDRKLNTGQFFKTILSLKVKSAILIS